MSWPASADELVAQQHDLAAAAPPVWTPSDGALVGGVWVTFPRGLSGPGAVGDRAWAAAVVMDGRRVLARQVVVGQAAAGYVPGLLALRLGPLCEDVVRRLTATPDVLLVDATGRDHPRRAGFAVHLGFVLDLPTVGVTHRPLVASGAWPSDPLGSGAPLTIGDDVVATWVRTKPGTRPLVVHPGWRTDPAIAVRVVMSCVTGRRTPEPLRRAREAARRVRGSEDL